MKRREFLTAAGAAATAISARRVRGANDRLGMAVVGSGRRGRHIMSKMLETGRVELRAICDVYDEQRRRARGELGLTVPVYETVALEDVLARRDVDAVLLATPDHLHEEYAIAILGSGRHLYLEKPATLRHDQDAPLLRAVRASGRVCQTGTQQRSATHYREAQERFFGERSPLGDVVFVRAVWSDFSWQRRQIEPRPRPEGLDWDRFLGPAPAIPFDWPRYDAWRNYREYGGGILSDLLTHWADVAQWMMGDARPQNAVTSGGIYYLHDGRSNPDTVNTILQYRGGWNLSFECSVMPVLTPRASVLFQGTDGSLEIDREGFTYTPRTGEPQVVTATTDLDLEHVVTFLDAVRSGRRPSADIEIGLQAMRPVHLALAAYWKRKRMRFDEAGAHIVEDV
jgi:predicted dehydrogenase